MHPCRYEVKSKRFASPQMTFGIVLVQRLCTCVALTHYPPCFRSHRVSRSRVAHDCKTCGNGQGRDLSLQDGTQMVPWVMLVRGAWLSCVLGAPNRGGRPCRALVGLPAPRLRSAMRDCFIYAQPAGLLTLDNAKPMLVAEAHLGPVGRGVPAAGCRLTPVPYRR